MGNLVTRDPLTVDTLLDDLLKGFFVRPMRLHGGETEMQIKVDVKEDDRNYTVHADMPGVKKDDIHVSVEGAMVTLTGEINRESERQEGEKLIRNERYHGKMTRSFTLGQEVNEAEASAKFDNGVLELVLPKKAMSKARRLTIE